MITEEQALEIAKSVIPDIEERLLNISMEKPKAKLWGGVPNNCWYIIYSYRNPDGTDFEGLRSDEGIFVNFETGKIVFNGCLRNEG